MYLNQSILHRKQEPSFILQTISDSYTRSHLNQMWCTKSKNYLLALLYTRGTTCKCIFSLSLKPPTENSSKSISAIQ